MGEEKKSEKKRANEIWARKKILKIFNKIKRLLRRLLNARRCQGECSNNTRLFPYGRKNKVTIFLGQYIIAYTWKPHTSIL